MTLVGLQDAASAMPSDASRLFAKNVANLLALMTADGKVVPDFDDEVVAGACLTHGGCVRHAATAEALEALNDGSDHAADRGGARCFRGIRSCLQVTSKLHTPLMSGANAIHGIILVGAIIVAGQASDPWLLTIALIAVVLATVNLVGGFVVTDRMLEMFGSRKPSRPLAACRGGRHMSVLGPGWTALFYLAASVCFILALKGLSSPRTARRGNAIGAAGALFAVVTVFLSAKLENIPLILAAIAVGSAVAVPVARRVQMTADAAAGRPVQRGRRRRRGAGGAFGTWPQ